MMGYLIRAAGSRKGTGLAVDIPLTMLLELAPLPIWTIELGPPNGVYYLRRAERRTSRPQTYKSGKIAVNDGFTPRHEKVAEAKLR